ncbi:hypothetical protein ACFV0W_34565, partial [Streptomyces anulatus]
RAPAAPPHPDRPPPRGGGGGGRPPTPAPPPAGRTYELSGPRALTFAGAVETIARAAGRPVRYEELTAEAYRAELLAQGWPEAAADSLGAMFALHRAGHSAEVTDGVRRVLGREAADLEPWARRIAATGVWA